MGDVLDVVARSRRSLVVIGLPETKVVAVSDTAAELYGDTGGTLIGRHATSLYRGADEVHASIALSAMASGAIDSYSAQRRLATPTKDSAWVSARRFELDDGAIAVKLSVPIDQSLPLDGIEQEFAAGNGIAWASRPVNKERFGAEGAQSRINASVLETLDGLPLRQRHIVAALLQGERTQTIAASMFVSNSTVRSHLSALFKAFGVRSQTELLSLLRNRPTDRRRPPT
jgi:DNA-binding CsgD family transcriptional regulator